MSIWNTFNMNFLVKGKKNFGDSFIISAIKERMKSIFFSAYGLLSSYLESFEKWFIIFLWTSVLLVNKFEYPLANNLLRTVNEFKNSYPSTCSMYKASLFISFSAVSTDYVSSMAFPIIYKGGNSSYSMDVSTG